MHQLYYGLYLIQKQYTVILGNIYRRTVLIVMQYALGITIVRVAMCNLMKQMMAVYLRVKIQRRLHRLVHRFAMNTYCILIMMLFI